MSALSHVRPLLACKFCGQGFYPDKASDLRAHELTCQPWHTERA